MQSLYEERAASSAHNLLHKKGGLEAEEKIVESFNQEDLREKAML